MSGPTLHPEFKEFLLCLKSHGVKFLVVGAHALAVLGRPRATQDIDIFVQPSRVNAGRLAAALSDFGFSEYATAAEAHFAVPGRMATLGREPVRIDILSSIAGVSFAEAWRGRILVTLDGQKLSFLGLASMRKNKQAAGRPKDLLDLALLDELEGAKKTPRKTKKKSAPATFTSPTRRKDPAR